MKKILLLAFSVFLISNLFSKAQSPDDLIADYLKLVATGRVDEVKMALPDLLAAYPEDPGVNLVHGVVIEDAFRALDIYKRIINDYPDSKWADDAYWRVVQFYAVLGDTTQARISLHKFRQNYPDSEYIGPAADVVRSSVGLARSGKKSTTNSYRPEYKPKERVVRHEEDDLVDPSTQPVTRIQRKKEKPVFKYEPKENTNTIPKEEQPASRPVITQPEEKSAEPVKTDKTLANVEPTPETQVNNSEPSGESTGWGLQVGIYSSKDAAEAEMRKFLRQRMRTEVFQKVINNEMLYAVVIGNYNSKESAEAAKQIVQQQCSCTPIVFKK